MMTDEQNTRWNNIRNYEPDDQDAALTFTDRLSCENDWREVEPGLIETTA